MDDEKFESVYENIIKFDKEVIEKLIQAMELELNYSETYSENMEYVIGLFFDLGEDILTFMFHDKKTINSNQCNFCVIDAISCNNPEIKPDLDEMLSRSFFSEFFYLFEEDVQVLLDDLKQYVENTEVTETK